MSKLSPKQAIMHPISFCAYTPNAVPERDIAPDEALVWIKLLEETHRPEGVVLPFDPTTDIQTALHNNLDAIRKNRVARGELVPGPWLLAGKVSLSGIGLWAEKRKDNSV